jgi:small conductance mechanosensitive channel
VEKISLRTIKFRSLDGTLNIIPNGSIANVSNKTYQWSRAVVKVGVSYDQRPENVLAILNEVSREMAEDPAWKDIIIEEPTPQGIISFGDSAVDFRVLAKTRPGDQWIVERELHIRIKNAFDRNGIEIPYNYINLIDRTEKKE